MKELTIDGQTFQYEIDWETGKTRFYQGEERVKVCQLFFWRPAKYVMFPKLVFIVPEDIECDQFTKENVRVMIRREIERLKRPAEILRGEIV